MGTPICRLRRLPTRFTRVWPQAAVDLTHTFGPRTLHWKGFPHMQIMLIFSIRKGGFKRQRYAFAGQWGTHTDAPARFHEGLRTVNDC